jgi:hypothetical protein
VQINDPRTWPLFKAAAYVWIADFEPYRRRFQRGFLKRLQTEDTRG